MKWNRFSIKTVTSAEDMIIYTLGELGIEGVEIYDKQPLSEEDKAQMFVDLPDAEEDDGIAILSFYMEDGLEYEPVLANVKNALDELRTYMEIGEGTIMQSTTEDKDWINNWKKYFHQFYVDDVLIVPSWEEVPQNADASLVLHIDPGTAFGTGMHETTQLVIKQIKKMVKGGEEILDVGTGSGILGILALKLGAKHIVGTDLDPNAVPAVRENKDGNDIADETFDLLIGNIVNDKEVQDTVGYEKYDFVLANILPVVLVPLTPVITAQMKKGSYYITSGILEERKQDVLDAIEAAGLTFVELTQQGEWVCITARKD